MVWVLVALYTGVFSWASILKYRYYLYDDFDLAIFAQAMSGMLRGTWFSSIRGMNWLGDHSSLILILLVPLYAVVRSPMTLLVVQSFMLGVGAVPVYLLARDQLASPLAGLGFAALYLLYPALGYSNLYEFHPETLCTAALLLAFYYLLRRSLGRTVLFATLALLGREDVALVIGAMALYALSLPRPRRWTYAAALAGLAAVSLVLSFAILKPALNAGRGDLSLLYAGWGNSAAAIASSILRHPFRAVQWLFSTPGAPVDTALKQRYYVQMLLPLACLPLLSPLALLIAAPILFEFFLSGGLEPHTIFYHSTALITPFFVAAAVLGARNLTRWSAGLRKPPLAHGRAPDPAAGLTIALPVLALLASVGSNVVFGPLLGRASAFGVTPESTRPGPMDRTLRPYRDGMVSRVPAAGGIVASFEFLPRFADRPDLHSLHHILCGHYTISKLPYPTPRGVEAMVAELDPERTLASVDLATGRRLRDLMAANGLRLADNVGNLFLYARGEGGRADSVETWSAGSFPVANPKHLVFDGQLAYLGDDAVRMTAGPGDILTIRTYWQRLRKVDRVYVLLYALLDERNAPACQISAFMGSPTDPVDRWPSGTTVRTTYRMIIPPDLQPGQYTLALRLAGWDGQASSLSRCDDPGLAANRMLWKIGSVVIGDPPR